MKRLVALLLLSCGASSKEVELRSEPECATPLRAPREALAASPRLDRIAEFAALEDGDGL